jgi:hypothetical protein
VPFVGHGHKISFAVVSSAVASDPGAAGRAASALALDVALWDQKGCLSPQMCYVEGDWRAALAFAERLASPLQELALRLPAGPTTIDEQLALRRFREQAEWEGIATGRAAVLAPQDSLAWTVVVDADAALRPTPLCRSLRVVPFAADADLRRALHPSRRFLEAAGVAAPPGRARTLGDLLARAGVQRVCPLGAMQRPPLAWRQGGRPRVGDWVSWSVDER